MKPNYVKSKILEISLNDVLMVHAHLYMLTCIACFPYHWIILQGRSIETTIKKKGSLILFLFLFSHLG